MENQKLKFFGTLNQANFMLGQALRELGYLWTDGVARLTDDDIAQIDIALRDLRKKELAVRNIKKDFQGIAGDRVLVDDKSA